jgi:hypothetical protein
MCGVWREYDFAGVEGGEFILRLIPRQKVAPLYWRSDTHTNTHTHTYTYGIKCKPTSVKNPQANAILERILAVLRNMLRTSELNMAKRVKPTEIDIFLSDAAWAVCSTYHTVLKASPGAAIFRQDMLFDIPFIDDWQKIGEHRQRLTDLNNASENERRIDYDYKVGQKVLLRKEGILHTVESRWHKYISPYEWNNHGSTWK